MVCLSSSREEVNINAFYAAGRIWSAEPDRLDLRLDQERSFREHLPNTGSSLPRRDPVRLRGNDDQEGRQSRRPVQPGAAADHRSGVLRGTHQVRESAMDKTVLLVALIAALVAGVLVVKVAKKAPWLITVVIIAVGAAGTVAAQQLK